MAKNSKVQLVQKQAGNYSNIKVNQFERNTMNKCPHCENMAKNFLYLESLIRNNYDKNQKCSLCQSSLKYLQYVNRNIMQVFGSFDSIVQAARVFSSKVPPMPKYEVKKQEPATPVRAKGGAMLKTQKSAKALKSVKSEKSKKSLKSSKSSKSSKSLSKSNKNKPKAGQGKMMLKRKYKSKSTKTIRSASQYQNMHSIRSKLSEKSKNQKKQRLQPPPTSINWNLLKRNMPKRMQPLAVK